MRLKRGGIPERPKGADCKSVVTDFGGSNPPSPTKQKPTQQGRFFVLVGEAGFGPAKSVTTDLQSAPFGRSGIPPYFNTGAGERSRTINLLITNQLLCH